MLKRVAVSEVRLGMHLERLEGPWLAHPFWRTRFTIEDAADLARLRGSAVTHCWIDDAHGWPQPEPSDDDAVAVMTAVATQGARVAAASAARVAPPQPGSELASELGRAVGIVKQGRAAVGALLNEVRLGHAVDARTCLPLVEEISGSVMRNPGALISLARLKTADDYSYMHSVAVCALMVALGRQLGMDEAACRTAGLAGLLHDLGKALVPLEILNKPGRLTDAERCVIQAHPQQGHDLLLGCAAVGSEALDVCLHHHERPDGQGYPFGLAGGQVSLLARMGAVCDVYDAITSNRPYKPGWDPAESIAQMGSWSGQFDPDVFKAFVHILGIYPTGSLVRLASGRLAVVQEQNPDALVLPVVRVFFSTRSQMPIPPRRLELAAPGCKDRIVGREDPARWGFPHLNDLWIDGDLLRRSR